VFDVNLFNIIKKIKWFINGLKMEFNKAYILINPLIIISKILINIGKLHLFIFNILTYLHIIYFQHYKVYNLYIKLKTDWHQWCIYKCSGEGWVFYKS